MSENKQEADQILDLQLAVAEDPEMSRGFSAIEKRYQETETPWSIHLYQAVGSTMDTAERIFRDKSEHVAVVSLTQSRGRGQRGKSWFSAEVNLDTPAGLYATFTCRMPMTPQALSGISLAVGVAVRQAVAELGVATMLKWPNDIVVLADAFKSDAVNLNAKKLAGILIESSSFASNSSESVLSVGIGLNINVSDFPKNLSATSLSLQSGKSFSLLEVFEQVLENLSFVLSRFSAEGLQAEGLSKGSTLIEEYRNSSLDIGRSLRISSEGDVLARIRKVNDDGSLQVELQDGRIIEKVFSGVLEGVYAS